MSIEQDKHYAQQQYEPCSNWLACLIISSPIDPFLASDKAKQCRIAAAIAEQDPNKNASIELIPDHRDGKLLVALSLQVQENEVVPESTALLWNGLDRLGLLDAICVHAMRVAPIRDVPANPADAFPFMDDVSD